MLAYTLLKNRIVIKLIALSRAYWHAFEFKCARSLLFFLYVPNSPTKYTLTGIAQLHKYWYT